MKISDFSFIISFLFFRIIFCCEDFRFFFYQFIPFFLDDFPFAVKISFFFFYHFMPVFLEDFPFAVKISFFLLQFLSCFSGSFSAVKISDFSFIISFLFFFSFPISLLFVWSIFCGEDFRLFIYHFIPVFPDHFLL